MEKEENTNQENDKAETPNEEIKVDKQPGDKQEEIREVEEKVELSPEEKIKTKTQDHLIILKKKIKSRLKKKVKKRKF